MEAEKSITTERNKPSVSVRALAANELNWVSIKLFLFPTLLRRVKSTKKNQRGRRRAEKRRGEKKGPGEGHFPLYHSTDAFKLKSGVCLFHTQCEEEATGRQESKLWSFSAEALKFGVFYFEIKLALQ